MLKLGEKQRIAQHVVQQMHPTSELRHVAASIYKIFVYLLTCIYVLLFWKVSVCVCACSLNKRKTHQDPSKLLLFHPSGPCQQRSPASLLPSLCLCCLSLSLGWDSSASCYQKFFWGGWGSLKCLHPVTSLSLSRAPTLASSVLFCECSLSGVAALC